MRYISQFKAYSSSVKKLSGTTWAGLSLQVEEGHQLCALYDVLISSQEREQEQAYGFRAPISRTVFAVIATERDLDPELWAQSGWVWFFSVPQWLIESPIDI